ncbi:hypothetical protein SEA_CACTUSROSE_55 [Mycobacterium phage CactusRose]|nr:hypothetical protein SEA_CACTUSROSE_55 [Mycobacterium phage CactusRose]
MIDAVVAAKQWLYEVEDVPLTVHLYAADEIIRLVKGLVEAAEAKR